MTNLEYLIRQAEKAKINYNIAIKRPGVTQKELDDLKSKVRYYETAVEAMKNLEKNNENH